MLKNFALLQSKRVIKIQQYIKSLGIIWTILFVLRWFLLRGNIQIVDKHIVKPIEKLMINLENTGMLLGLLPRNNRKKPVTFTRIELIKFSEESSYYSGRWEYFHEAIGIIRKEEPDRVLELGPHLLPIVKNSDTMDRNSDLPNLTYIHDATIFPWPIEDNSYDMFLALQVWEHLKDKQKEAFREVMRISRLALLSFPYKWYRPGNCHHNIDEAKIAEWTLHIQPTQITQIGTRILYFFRFDNF